MTSNPERVSTLNRWRIEWHEALDSTMSRATELAETGAPPGAVVVTDFQRAGRGTHGRTWSAPPGTCLMFTILARPRIHPSQLERLPAAIAGCLADAVAQHTGLDASIKEPNDIVVGGKKLCGVLCSSRITGETLEWLLCGVGLNTHMRADQLPLAAATSLFCEGVEPMPAHEELLDALLGSLEWVLNGDTPGCGDRADKPILSRVAR